MVDARESPHLVQRLGEEGHDLDQGMVVVIGNAKYFGGDAMQILSLLSASTRVFNRFNLFLFRSPFRARLAYPVFRSLRRIILWGLRRPGIVSGGTD